MGYVLKTFKKNKINLETVTLIVTIIVIIIVIM